MFYKCIPLLLSFSTSIITPAVLAKQKEIYPDALPSNVWQTTAVYEAQNMSLNVIDKYPGVVGVSIWDANTNRFEYFDPTDWTTRAKNGGAGYFLITGNKREQINFFDNGVVLARTLEKLTPNEFTYSRTVPREMKSGAPDVTIFVVHTPLKVEHQFTFSPNIEKK